ncbi:hypothetical protein [Streptomyces sp. SA15]|nr:hypothetical protein [Streptomyces sp. SA15]
MTTPPTSALGLDFNTPVQDRYFEDYTPGSTYTALSAAASSSSSDSLAA